jgi:thioredoxin-dependent peroxiredoxin
LLSDPDRAVAAQLGAKRNFGPLKTKRVTYVIDTDRTLLDVINSEVSMSTHADKALAVLKSRAS